MTSPPAAGRKPLIVCADHRLTSNAVRRLLEAEGLPVICGPYGFDLPCDRSNAATYARLERGSGIAGRGYSWHIVCKALGTSPSVTSLKGLRRILREWRTGEQQPPPRPGYQHYAKLNRNQYGEAYVWVTRRV